MQLMMIVSLSGVYDLVCKLLVFRDVEGFISGDDLKIMDDFCSLYSDFDNVKDEINGIVERQLLLRDYLDEKNSILDFIDFYTIDDDCNFDDFVSDSVKEVVFMI